MQRRLGQGTTLTKPSLDGMMLAPRFQRMMATSERVPLQRVVTQPAEMRSNMADRNRTKPFGSYPEDGQFARREEGSFAARAGFKSKYKQERVLEPGHGA